MFREAVKITGMKPRTLISDGAANFHEAWKDEWKAKNFLHKKTIHISHIHMKNDRNNNKMERLNGELRDREKVMRSLKTVGIDGKTPSEKAGIKIEGSNKWITLIQNAKAYQTKVNTKNYQT